MNAFLVYERTEQREDFNITMGIFTRIFGFLVFDLVFYVQQKEQAKIFLSKINVEQ